MRVRARDPCATECVRVSPCVLCILCCILRVDTVVHRKGAVVVVIVVIAVVVNDDVVVVATGVVSAV